VHRAPYELQFDDDRLAESLDRMCEAITEEVLVRRSLDKKQRPYKSSRKWMKTICYNAILTCMYHGVLEELTDRAERFGRSERGPKANRSIFDDSLMGIFAHERPVDSKELLDRKDRERLAKEMWWGFRHYMEPSELVAFNRRHPLHRDDSTSPDKIVPSFYNKIVKRKLLFYSFYISGMNVEEYRGRHDKRIEDHVERLQLIIERFADRYRSMQQIDDDDDDWEIYDEDDEPSDASVELGTSGDEDDEDEDAWYGDDD